MKPSHRPENPAWGALALAVLAAWIWLSATPGLSRSEDEGLFLPLVVNRPGVGTVGHLMITEVLYDPDAAQGGVEWIEIFNPIGEVVALSGYKIGDEESLGGNEGMLQFPPGAEITVGASLVIAEDATAFKAAYGFDPNFEFSDSGSPVPEMVKYTAWAGGSLALTNGGDEVLLLDIFDNLVDSVSWGSSGWAFEPDLPVYPKGHSAARITVFQDSDSAADWFGQPDPTPGWNDLQPPAPTPSPGPTPTPFAGGLLISELVFDAAGSEPDEEWIEIYNLTAENLDISNFKIGDEETPSGSEGMYRFPPGSSIGFGEALVIANRASAFESRYGFKPDFEVHDSDPLVPDMVKHGSWSAGNLSLSNSGDEVLLLDYNDQLADAVSWGNSTWAFSPAVPPVGAGESIERFPPGSDNDNAADWRAQPVPSPGSVPGTGGPTPTP